MTIRHQQPTQPRRCGRPGCDQPAGDAYVCGTCEHRLGRDLRQAAQLASEVFVTISRRDRHGTGGKSSHEPLPVNLAASARFNDIATTIATTARWVASVRDVPLELGRAPAQRASLWLTRHLGWIRQHPEAARLYSDLSRACASLRNLVDSPPAKRFLGTCDAPVGTPIAWPCPSDLHAHDGATMVKCPTCGAQHDVAKRRAWLDELVRGYSYTIADIAAAYDLSASTLRTWADRGRITVRGYDIHGRKLFQLGEVLDLAAEAAKRHAERQAKQRARKHLERSTA